MDFSLEPRPFSSDRFGDAGRAATFALALGLGLGADDGFPAFEEDFERTTLAPTCFGGGNWCHIKGS